MKKTAASRHGHRKMAVQVFPARLDAKGMAFLEKSAPSASTLAFWRELQLVYENFERTHDLLSSR
ncbi:MAG: hypothetical protein LBI48_06860 [Burkholderiaceae bacterium]|jgi:hypothetical protein|nr:hypothetical protein [Burkholderiaceae bacterium]